MENSYSITAESFSTETVVDMVKNIFDEVKEKGKVKNNLFSATKDPDNSITIKLKQDIIQDYDSVRSLLDEFFKQNRYRIDLFRAFIIIKPLS